MSWASLKHSWTHLPYTANVEFGAVQLLEFEGVASTTQMRLQEPEWRAILRKEPRCWATAGAFMDTPAAIAATLQLAQEVMAAQRTHKPGGEAAFWAGAVQYVLSLREARSVSAESERWDHLSAALCALQHEGALAWAFPVPGSVVDGRYVWERAKWLAFLLQCARERIADGLLLGDTDADLLRRASRVAASALRLHGEAVSAVRKEGADLQKMIQAAGGDAAPDGPAQGAHVSLASSAHDSGARMPPVLLWARRHEALQSGSVLGLCREHGHQVLPLLVEGPQSPAALEAAWAAVCALALTSAVAAVNAWLPFAHACRQQGTDMGLLLALTERKQPPHVCQLAEATALLATAWRGAARIQDWPLGAARKLMALSDFLVRALLQEVGQGGGQSSGSDKMDVDTEAVPDTPPDDTECEVVCEPCTRIPVLEEAVAANQRAVAFYATAAILSLGASGCCGPGLDALFATMTPALGSASSHALSVVLSRVTADLQHLCPTADGPPNSADGESGPGRVIRVRQLAAVAVLTRQRAFVEGLETAWQLFNKGRQRAGGRPAAEGLLSVREQGALLEHILLCPAVQPPEPTEAGEIHRGVVDELLQGCSLGRLLSVLQPLCEEYCKAYASAAKGVSGMAHASLLPHRLPQQVRTSCRGDGLSVQADSLACLCCSWGACLRAPVLDALSGLLHDEACGAAAQRLMSAVTGGLLPWLMSGAKPDQVPEEAWASLEASAEHLLNALDSQDAGMRLCSLHLLLDSLGCRMGLAAAFSRALARRGPAAASAELLAAARTSVKRLCALTGSLPASEAALLHLARCALAAVTDCIENNKEMPPRSCALSVCCLRQMAVAAPWALQRLESFPALLEQLVSLAYSKCAATSVVPESAFGLEDEALQVSAVETMVALAAHDEGARQVFASKLLPAAMAADASCDICWQAALAGCPAVFAAGLASVGTERGGDTEYFSVRSVIQSVAQREGFTALPELDGCVMKARRLCKLAQLMSSLV